MFILEFIMVEAGLILRYLTAVVGVELILFGLFSLFLPKKKKFFIFCIIPGLLLLFTYTSDFQTIKTDYLLHHVYKTSFTIYQPSYTVPGYPFRGADVAELPVAPNDKYYTDRYGPENHKNDYLDVTEFNASIPTFTTNIAPKTVLCGPGFPSDLTPPPQSCNSIGTTPTGIKVYEPGCCESPYYSFTINNTRITLTDNIEGESNSNSPFVVSASHKSELFKFIDSFKPVK